MLEGVAWGVGVGWRGRQGEKQTAAAGGHHSAASDQRTVREDGRKGVQQRSNGKNSLRGHIGMGRQWKQRGIASTTGECASYHRIASADRRKGGHGWVSIGV